MTTTTSPLPAGGRSREEIAKHEIGITTISRSTAWMTVVAFLVLIFTVPALEWLGASVGVTNESPKTWAHLTGIPESVRSRLAEARAAHFSLWGRTVAVNRGVLSGLQDFERGLEQESWLGQRLRPYAQFLLTRWLGAGNERVYPGRDGWLFYRPDVESVTGPGFLEPSQMARRIRSTPEWQSPPQPDPRIPLRQLKRDLEARGIALIVMPTPVKPTVHPEKLASRLAGELTPIQNASYARFVADLNAAGVLVFDSSPILAAERRTSPQFMATDTHWRPEALERAAEALVAFIEQHVSLPRLPEPAYRLERIEFHYPGDIARMLDLPPRAQLFAPDHIWPTLVVNRDGSPWRASREADVLLLGDSFSNIYTGETFGGPRTGGLAAHVSYLLRRPLDRITENGGGSYATREMLQRDPDRLEGKKLVVYQFATRELAFGDWKVISLAVSRSTNKPR
ncbi:MAG: alginate O-acetyltransferase AlgX-related protein [Acidobacteriota bacterium]